MKFTTLATLLPLLAAAAPSPAPSSSDPPSYPPRIGIMSARSASPIHLMPMNAAGRAFWLGGHPATYCPVQVGDDCPPGNETVISGLSSLNVLVPGGQQMYVEPSGAVGFTQAHSVSIPEGSYIGGFTYEAGEEHGRYSFGGWDADGFMACPKEGSDYYQVFANMKNASVPTGHIEDCLGFVAMAFNSTGDPAAWQYT